MHKCLSQGRVIALSKQEQHANKSARENDQNILFSEDRVLSRRGKESEENPVLIIVLRFPLPSSFLTKHAGKIQRQGTCTVHTGPKVAPLFVDAPQLLP